MKQKIKDNISKATKIGTLIGMIYTAGLTTGVIWVSHNEFDNWLNTAFAAVVQEVGYNTKSRNVDRFWELDNIYQTQQNTLTPIQLQDLIDEICELATELRYPHELCR